MLELNASEHFNSDMTSVRQLEERCHRYPRFAPDGLGCAGLHPGGKLCRIVPHRRFVDRGTPTAEEKRVGLTVGSASAESEKLVLLRSARGRAGMV